MNALDGVEGKPPHWTAQCPVPWHHEDGRPDTDSSLDIRVAPHRDSQKMTVLVICGAGQCGARLPDVCRAVGVKMWRVLDGNEVYRNCKPAPPRRRLTVRDVGRWHQALLDHPEHLAYVMEVRGLILATIEEHWLGYDTFGRFTLPVWADNLLVNVRRYLPDAEPGNKMRNFPGYGTPARLYPSLAPSGPVVICEGEWDALVLNQHCIPAVTSTHGAATFLPEWVPLFKSRPVAFLYDCDDAGRTCSTKHAEIVATVARSVRVVDLDPVRDDKWDVSDWFNDGRSRDDLRALINATPKVEVVR